VPAQQTRMQRINDRLEQLEASIGLNCSLV